MERKVGATEARIHLGELMRRVAEDGERIIIHRGGNPYAVLLSYEEYRRLQEAKRQASWRERLKAVLQVGADIRGFREGVPLPPPGEVVHEAREERDAQVAGLP